MPHNVRRMKGRTRAWALFTVTAQAGTAAEFGVQDERVIGEIPIAYKDTGKARKAQLC